MHERGASRRLLKAWRSPVLAALVSRSAGKLEVAIAGAATQERRENQQVGGGEEPDRRAHAVLVDGKIPNRRPHRLDPF